MDRTLFSPTMLEAFRACKRAYFLAYHRDGAEQARGQASSICKRFILRGLAEINRARLTSVSQIQKFMGESWPVERLSGDPDLKDAATRAFLFTYKTLLRYQSQPYLPKGAQVEGVSTRVRSRVQDERVYLEEVFDLVLWYPEERKLELVIFNLRPVKEINPAWPSATLLVRQYLAERLKVRLPYERLVLTNIKVGPQEMKVTSREASSEMYRLHWPEIVKSLSEMKELADMPEHDEVHGKEGCTYCRAIESRMAAEVISVREVTSEDALGGDLGGKYPLSA